MVPPGYELKLERALIYGAAAVYLSRHMRVALLACAQDTLAYSRTSERELLTGSFLCDGAVNIPTEHGSIDALVAGSEGDVLDSHMDRVRVLKNSLVADPHLPERLLNRYLLLKGLASSENRRASARAHPRRAAT